MKRFCDNHKDISELTKRQARLLYTYTYCGRPSTWLLGFLFGSAAKSEIEEDIRMLNESGWISGFGVVRPDRYLEVVEHLLRNDKPFYAKLLRSNQFLYNSQEFFWKIRKFCSTMKVSDDVWDMIGFYHWVFQGVWMPDHGLSPRPTRWSLGKKAIDELYQGNGSPLSGSNCYSAVNLETGEITEGHNAPRFHERCNVLNAAVAESKKMLAEFCNRKNIPVEEFVPATWEAVVRFADDCHQ